MNCITRSQTYDLDCADPNLKKREGGNCCSLCLRKACRNHPPVHRRHYQNLNESQNHICHCAACGKQWYVPSRQLLVRIVIPSLDISDIRIATEEVDIADPVNHCRLPGGNGANFDSCKGPS